MIPAYGPYRIGGGVGVALEAAGAGDLGELVAADDGPGVGAAVPSGEGAGGDVGPGLGFLPVLAVVGVDEQALPGVETLAVVAGEVGAPERLLELFVAE